MKFQKFRRMSAYATCLFFSSQITVSAQNVQDPLTTRLDDITITARPLENSVLLVPAQQLSGAALTQRLGSTLGETLDNLPGIANSSFGPNVGRPTIRGMDGDRIRILQNSGANMDVSGLSFDHAVPIDPLTTERIEILRGPATLLYGGSAIGGVVNVIDNRIARERAFDAKGGVMGKAEVRVGGAANERSTGAMVETGTDKFAIHIDAFDRRTQNLKVPKNMSCESGVNSVKVCNSASNTKGGAVGGTLFFDRGYLGLSTSEYKSTYGTVAEEYVTIGMVRRHHALEGKLRDVGEWFQDVKFQGGYTNYSHTEYTSNVAGPIFDTNGTDIRLEARQRSISLGNGLQLEGMLGLQRENNNLGASGAEKFIPSSRTHSTSLFTYQALKTSWGQWSAGARTEGVSVQSLENIASTTTPISTISAQTKTFNPLSFALGVMRNLRTGEMQEGWQITSNLSASQRAPKDYELFANGAHAATGSFEVGSPNNTLEKATQLDVGGEWKKGVHKFGLTTFTSNFSNYISLQASGANSAANAPIYNFQGVRARFMGLESHAKLRMVGGQQALLSNDAQHGAVDLELRGDMVRADDLTNGRPMPRIAPMRLGADALWSKNAWGARFGFMHAGAQNRMPYYTGVTTVPTAAYTMWNAGLNYRAHSGQTNWMFFAKLDNLTNKLAYSSTSVLTQTMLPSNGLEPPPFAGRSLKLGLQASF